MQAQQTWEIRDTRIQQQKNAISKDKKSSQMQITSINQTNIISAAKISNIDDCKF